MNIQRRTMRYGIVLGIVAAFVGCERPTHQLDHQPEAKQPPIVVVEPTPAVESVVFSKPILAEFSGKCVKVIDGDTIDVLTAGNATRRVRFESIDTPERGQPFGNNATEFVKARCIGKEVTVLVTGTDKYKRDLGYVISVGNVNADLVAAGLAWVYRDYSDDPLLISSELNARNRKLGLWQDNRRVARWDWRKLSKVERDLLR